jgi:hypothetical protein
VRGTIIFLTTAVALVGLALTQTGRGEPSPAPIAAKPLAAAAAPQPSSDHSAVGTLDQFDGATQQLTVATASGRLAFRVQAGATIRQGSKTLKPAELAAHKGERVKVRYRETGGERHADWIVLAAPARKTARTK